MAERVVKSGGWSPREVWSPEKAAEVLGVTPDHVRLLLRRGDLQGILERRRWYVDPDSVRRRVARKHQQGFQFAMRHG